MDSAQWPQVSVKSMGEEEGKREVVQERRGKTGKDQILSCPRCSSNNTKFCYYNNYSLSQPRYFCKSCRRYWTAGGCLRNIPVGGASRKNKRPSPIFSSPKNNNIEDQSKNHIMNDSKLSISSPNSYAATSCCWLPSDHDHDHHHHMNQMIERELIPFMPMPAAAAAAAAPQPASMCPAAADDQCNTSRNMNNSNDGLLFGSEEDGDQAAGRLMFSSGVEDFKQLPTVISADQNGGKLGDVPAFWNGIFGGSSW